MAQSIGAGDPSDQVPTGTMKMVTRSSGSFAAMTANPAGWPPNSSPYRPQQRPLRADASSCRGRSGIAAWTSCSTSLLAPAPAVPSYPKRMQSSSRSPPSIFLPAPAFVFIRKMGAKVLAAAGLKQIGERTFGFQNSGSSVAAPHDRSTIQRKPFVPFAAAVNPFCPRTITSAPSAMDPGAAVRANAISDFSSGIKYSLTGAMAGSGNLLGLRPYLVVCARHGSQRILRQSTRASFSAWNSPVSVLSAFRGSSLVRDRQAILSQYYNTLF